MQYRRNSRGGSHSEGGDALSVAHGGTLNSLEAAAQVDAFTLMTPTPRPAPAACTQRRRQKKKQVMQLMIWKKKEGGRGEKISTDAGGGLISTLNACISEYSE